MQPVWVAVVGTGVGKKFIVVLNHAAGTVGRKAEPVSADAVAKEFAAVGVTADVREAAGAQLDEAVRAALAARPHAVVVGGGDGTVRAAAAAAVGGEVPLGVLPLGTLNHFAKDLRMPADWREAVAVLAWALVYEVDVGEVNGRVFVNNCSLGAYAEAVRRRDALRLTHGHGKAVAMVRAAWQVFRNLRRMRLRVTLAGAAREERTPLFVVANNRYTGQVLGASLRARLDEGRLWTYSTRVRGRWAALRLAWQALTRRRPDEADELNAEPTAALRVESLAGPVPVAMDGEVVEVTFPLEVRVRPKALRVLAPPEKGGRR